MSLWFLINRYSLLTAFFGFICACLSIALLISLGLVSSFSFMMGMPFWATLTVAATGSYFLGGLIAATVLPVLPIKKLQSGLTLVNRFKQTLSGVFFLSL